MRLSNDLHQVRDERRVLGKVYINMSIFNFKRICKCIYFTCMTVLYASMSAPIVYCLLRPKEGIKSPGTGVISDDQQLLFGC